MQPVTTQLKEQPDRRAHFGGGDGHAINKHSTREYGFFANETLICTVELDRTLDGAPPFFCAYLLNGKALPPRLSVLGQEYFGDGMSWHKAAQLLKESLDYKYRNGFFECHHVEADQ